MLYRKFMRHVLGAYSDNTVDALKKYLGVEKLDLVLLDSFEEYMRLVAEEGIPRARTTKSQDTEPMV